MSNDQLGCYGCFHASSLDGKSPDQLCRECSMCLRNPIIMSRKDNPKTINVDGIEFPFPIDMYITRDRLMYEDYMRAKKILKTIQDELDKRAISTPAPKSDPWKDIYPHDLPKPYDPGVWQPHPYWKYQKATSNKYKSKSSE